MSCSGKRYGGNRVPLCEVKEREPTGRLRTCCRRSTRMTGVPRMGVIRMRGVSDTPEI